MGGGALVAEQISAVLGTTVPLLGKIPFDVALREGGDSGRPLVLSDPDAPASRVLRAIAEDLGRRPRGLAGVSLGLTPASRA
jgi:ATP-binding protein involved in chromosome partitioning